MQFHREKFVTYIICAIILIVFVAGLIDYGISFQNAYEVLVLSPLSKVSTFVQNTYESVRNYFVSIKEGVNLIKENSDLKNEVSTLQARLKLLLGYYYENQELKNLLGIKNTLVLDTKACSVVFYDKINSFLIIDVGSADGVSTNMPVVYSYDGATSNLVGKVIECSKSTSKVSLVFSPHFKVGVTNASRGGIDIAEGSGESLEVSRLSSKVVDVVGDVFVTVGESNIFPPNIVVGKVTKIDKVNMEENRIVLSPMINFDQIRNVLLIMNYEKK
jgi:rod shape-determining protein MreC